MTTRTDYTGAVRDAAEHLGTFAWIVTDTFDPGDPWGSVMGSMFTLNDAILDVGGEPNPTFRQSPMGADDNAEYLTLVEAVETGGLTVEQVEATERALDAVEDELRDAGLNY